MKTGYRQSPGSNCPRRGAAMARHGRRPSPAPAARPVRFFYETRDTAFMLFTNHETRNTDFVAVVFAVGAQGTHNQEPPPGLPPPPPGRCLPARCGAAWGGYGAAWAAAVPRSATRPVGLSPATNHATCFPPALRRLQGEQLQARPTGFSRITAFFRITAFYPPRCPVHYCPPLPGIARHCSAKNIARQVSPHRQPFSKGLAARSRCLPGALGCGDDKMKPC